MTDPPASPEARRAARDLRVAMARVRRRMREAAGGGDELSPLQSAVLIDLDRRDADTAAALAALEGVRPQTMATAIEALQARGFVARRPDPDDGRRQLIELTDAGRDAEAGRVAARNEWLAQRIQARLTEAERGTLVGAAALIERLARSADD